MKRYFKEQRVLFKEVNIERDPDAARDIVRKTGQTGVPVIEIGGSWIVGFDKKRMDKELARKARRRRLASPEQSRRRFREQLHRNVGFIRRGASSCTLPICCGRAPVLTGFEAALLPDPGTVMRDAGCGLRGTTLPRTSVNKPRSGLRRFVVPGPPGPAGPRAPGAGPRSPPWRLRRCLPWWPPLALRILRYE